MSRKKTVKRSVKKQTSKNQTKSKISPSHLDKQEMAFLAVPKNLAANCAKEAEGLKKKQAALKKAFAKAKKELKKAGLRLNTAAKAKKSVASKKQLLAAKKSHQQSNQSILSLKAELQEIKTAFQAALNKRNKMQALKAHLAQFEKAWAKKEKLANKPKPKRKNQRKKTSQLPPLDQENNIEVLNTPEVTELAS